MSIQLNPDIFIGIPPRKNWPDGEDVLNQLFDGRLKRGDIRQRDFLAMAECLSSLPDKEREEHLIRVRRVGHLLADVLTKWVPLIGSID